MLTIPFEIITVAAAFFLGAFEGPRLWAWLKGWLVKEEQAIVAKIEGHSGPSGATGA